MFQFQLQMRNAMVWMLAAMIPVVSAAAAESHVVPLTELHQAAVVASTEARGANLARVEHFFSSDVAQASLRAAKIDGDQVMKALPLLSDEELARLAARTDRLQTDFAAGALSTLHLTYIVIALAAAVFVLIIVAAR